jgi:hypothetical protein
LGDALVKRLDPGTARVPSVRLAAQHVEHVLREAATCVLLHHGTVPWHGELAPGFDFFVWATCRGDRGLDRVAARVRTLRVCEHVDVYSVRECPGGHRPETVEPGRAGWRRIWDAAALIGESRRLEAGQWKTKFKEPWSVVDFEFVGALERRAPRRRTYRNPVEAELAEQSRLLEAVRLAVEDVGVVLGMSDDERWFRAKSAVYNRKLSKALDAGCDTALLTVTEAEAELPRVRSRLRAAPAHGALPRPAVEGAVAVC